MMNLKVFVTRALLPTLLFGYAAVANGVLVLNLPEFGSKAPGSAQALLDGEITHQLDQLYKDRLPHKETSVGLVGAVRYLALGEGRKGVIVGKDKWLFSDEEFQSPVDPVRSIANAAQEIREVQDKLAAAGVTLVMVPLPAKLDIYRNELEDQTISASLARRYADFLEALAKEGVQTVDTRTALIEASKQDGVFLRTDTHWTPRGAAVVAYSVAKAVPDLEGSNQYILSAEEGISIQGDLTKFIADEGYSAFAGFPAEKISVRRAVASEPSNPVVSDIFGDALSIPVALVGTSYSANENWGFVDELKFALGADVLNVAEVGRGPVYPMRQYLRSDALLKSPPKIVLWEFPVRYLARKDLWDETPSREPSADQSVSVEPVAPTGSRL